MKLGSKPPRTPCSILCNLSSVTRARGSRAQCTNASRVREELQSWRFNLLGRDGKAVAVHRRGGGRSWDGRRRAAVDLGARREGWREAAGGRYATVHREVAGQQPPAVQTDVSSKATKPGCSSVTRFSVQKVGGRHVPGL